MKLLKGLLWVVLFVVIVLVGGAFFLVNKVDPNDYKVQIAEKVESQIGRKLAINGELSWRFYPWVGVTMSDFSLSNREGFEPDNMLAAQQVDVQIKLMPLISKQLEIGKIKLQAPKINLQTNAKGETNWGDLSGQPQAAQTDSGQAAGSMVTGLVIQGVDISQAQVDWTDIAAGQRYQLHDFNLSTGTIKPDEPITFELDSNVEGTALPESAKVSLKGDLLVNDAFDKLNLDDFNVQFDMGETEASAELESLQFAVDNGELAVDGLRSKISMDQITADIEADSLRYQLESGQAMLGKLSYAGQFELMPFEGESNDVRFDVNANTLDIATQVLKAKVNNLPIDLSAEQLQLDIGEQTLNAPVLLMQLDEARINANVKVKQLFGDMQANGQLESNQFNPRSLLDKIGINPLEDMPNEVVKSLELKTKFNASLSSILLDQLWTKLDETTIKGNFSLQDFTKPAYRFDIQLDQLNVDDYLSQENKEVAEQTGPGAAVALPFVALKGLDAKGSLSVAQLKLQNMESSDVVVSVDTSSDQIKVSPLQAKAYGGTTTNTIVYDISGNTPKVNITSKLTSLNLGPFLQAMEVTDRLDGFGNVDSNLNSAGLTADDMIANLSGNINIDLNDGAIRGADIQKSLIQVAGVVTQLKGKDMGLNSEVGDKTQFSNFSSHISVNKGVFSTSDIDLKAPGLRMTGGGDVDLNTDKLDLSLLVSIVGSFEGQGGEAVEKLKGQTIPIKISGSLASPRIIPDVSKILQNQLERKLSEKYLGGAKLSGDGLEQKAKDEVNRKLAEKLGLGSPEVTGAVEQNASNQGVTGNQADDVTPQSESAPKNSKDQVKQKIEDEKDKLKKKLLKGIFGS